MVSSRSGSSPESRSGRIFQGKTRLGLIYLHGIRLILMVNSLVEIYQSHVSLDADEPNCLSWKWLEISKHPSIH